MRGGIAAALAMSFLGLLPAEAAAQAFLQIAAHSQSDVLVAHSDAIAGDEKRRRSFPENLPCRCAAHLSRRCRCA